MYSLGHFVPKDINKGIECYERTLALTGAKARAAHFNLGTPDFLVWTNQLKGLRCIEGREVPKNLKQAVHHFQQSAERGSIKAHFQLGSKALRTRVSCDLGEVYCGEDEEYKDEVKGFQHYLIAADLGHKVSQFKIGYFYKTGCGTEQDLDKSMAYYLLAAEQGHVTAQYNLGLCPCSAVLTVGVRECLFKEWFGW